MFRYLNILHFNVIFYSENLCYRLIISRNTVRLIEIFIYNKNQAVLSEVGCLLPLINKIWK